MFLDSDDELYPGAAEALIRAAEETGAEVAAGITVRHEHLTRVREPWFPELFRQRSVVESLSEHPEVLQDTLSTNKAYRRSFLDEHGLRFTEGIHYEDQLFTLQVYLAVRRLVLVPERVYRWNVRSDGASITNQRSSLANVRHRLAANRLMDEVLAAHGDPVVRRAKDVKLVRNDLRVYLNDLWQRDSEFRTAFASEMGGYLGSLPEDSLAAMPPLHRAAVLLLRDGDLDGVLDVVEGMRRAHHFPAVLVPSEGALVLDRPATAALDLSESPLVPGAARAARLEQVVVQDDGVRLTVAVRASAVRTAERAAPQVTARVAPLGLRAAARHVPSDPATQHEEPDLWRVQVTVPFASLGGLPGRLRTWTVLLEVDGTAVTVGRPRAWAGDVVTPFADVTFSHRGDLRLVSSEAAATAHQLDALRLRLRRTAVGSAFRAGRGALGRFRSRSR
jgi:hypothetical protein